MYIKTLDVSNLFQITPRMCVMRIYNTCTCICVQFCVLRTYIHKPCAYKYVCIYIYIYIYMHTYVHNV